MENIVGEKQFLVENGIFKLLINSVLVAEAKFNVETQDEFFSEEYVSIYQLKTFEQFREKGYAKYLLNQIFNYVLKTLNINIVTLIVYKNNYKAINLYLSNGFEIFIAYDESYSLVKKIKK